MLRLLRIFLGISAFAWGISVVGVFASWTEAEQLLEGLGAKPIAYDPMLDYWLRMAAGAFALLGGWYLILMIWPRKFRAAIPWFGVLMLAEGVVLLIHGLRLALPPMPFYADAATCLIAGTGDFGLFKKVKLCGFLKITGLIWPVDAATSSSSSSSS